VILNYKEERIWKEKFVSSCKALARNFSGTEENIRETPLGLALHRTEIRTPEARVLNTALPYSLNI
jgi:hypothetical protein